MTPSRSRAADAAHGAVSPAPALPATADRLRTRGLRVTAPRLAVLDALPAGTHRGTDEIARAARHRLGSLSTQAVYDILHAFTEAGLVRRIEPAGRPARYESRAGDNHHHLVCRRCGAAVDVDCAAGVAPCLQPAVDAGYLVDEAEVIHWGYCPACRSGRHEKATREATTKATRKGLHE